jgi:rhodanese-related sulfurtransferase
MESGRAGRIRLFGVALCAAGALGCAEHIGRQQLLGLIEEGRAPTIVDVRSQGEYDTSHVPGAVHVPFYSLLGRTDELPAGRAEDRRIVVYCEHGPRAGLARAQLWLTSDRPVLFLDGHMTAWKADGLPVETGLAAE